MAYKLYLDGVLFPVAPSKVTVKINNQNETVTLINEGEANILKAAGLSDVEFQIQNIRLPYIQRLSGMPGFIWISWKN